MKNWQKVEAVLFGSGKYLTEEQISELSGIPKNKLKKALADLVKHYKSIETSLKIFHESNTWKLNVKEEYNDIMKSIISEAEMSKPVMETLAVIAYKAPVLQSEIIAARGSGAYEHISLLEEKGFIEKDKFARTYKLRLTDKFYDYFDIEGPGQIQEVFGDVKKPEKIGNLEVYDANEKYNEFEAQLTDRLKKLETTATEKKDNEEFLGKLDEKISQAKSRIDETEAEMAEFRRSEDKSEGLVLDDGTEDPGAKKQDDKPQEKVSEKSTEEILKEVNEDIEEITGEKEEKKEE